MPPNYSIPLTLVVATTKSSGIGFNGTIPWPMIKGEMAYFARVTKRVPLSSLAESTNPERQNAVIMGRTTYISLPSRVRPLPGRLNIVLSRRGKVDVPSGVVVANGFDEAMEHLSGLDKSGRLGRVFVIGGEETYRAALDRGAERILSSSVQKDNGGEWECDRHFPLRLWAGDGVVGEAGDADSVWRRCSADALDAWVGEAIAGEKTEGEGEKKVQWEVGMWERGES